MSDGMLPESQSAGLVVLATTEDGHTAGMSLWQGIVLQLKWVDGHVHPTIEADMLHQISCMIDAMTSMIVLPLIKERSTWEIDYNWGW